MNIDDMQLQIFSPEVAREPRSCNLASRMPGSQGSPIGATMRRGSAHSKRSSCMDCS
jgi:hypothetical protein